MDSTGINRSMRTTHYVFAGASFMIALVTYLLTMQPSIPFWDCGEFAAAAWALQVPHPPGSPLWTIIGRLGMLLPISGDLVARYNMLSVLSSALSIMLLYLTTVRLIKLWRGEPRSMSSGLMIYGGAFVAALSYTWTDSFWFNALECEVYAFGSLFISLVPWLILVWYDHAEEEHSEKYLLLIAYVIGLSLGVHQLALLTIFPVFMLVYYRRAKEVTVKGWLLMGCAAVAAFLVTYKLVLTQLVSWIGSGLGILAAICVIAAIVGVIYSEKNRKPVLNLSLWAGLMILLGYSTYMMVMVRAGQNPPMNQNAPDNFKKLAGYINRDQYGSAPIVPRRIEAQRADHEQTWRNYSSDGDFFWRYQTNFMYHRYLGWNFIGRQDDDKGAGVDFSKTWALPLLLGFFGLYWHFKRDPKRALSLLAMFIVLGWMTAWYQNQQDPQPRERDYFYVGAFYVFAMWVGIGATGLMESIAERKQEREDGDASTGLNPLVAGAFGLALVIAPLNQLLGLAGLATGKSFKESSKWAEYSRKNNYIPYDYAYNILQSCDPNAILFTYGDNDTFPLWCLQDVYSVRRDVRIVQLSLGQMFWYMQQMQKPTEWGQAPVKMSIFNQDVLSRDEQTGYNMLDWNPRVLNVPVSQAALRWMAPDSATALPSTLVWNAAPKGPSDLIVMDVIQNNLSDRPIYFSSTVPPSVHASIDDHLVYEGLAARVTTATVPKDNTGYGGAISPVKMAAHAFNVRSEPVATPVRGMMLRTYNDPTANMSSLDIQYAMSYRLLHIRMINTFLEAGDKAHAREAIATMNKVIPTDRVPLEYPYASLFADLSDRADDPAAARAYAKAAVAGIEKMKQNPNWREEDQYARSMNVDFSYADLLMKSGRYEDAKREFQTLKTQNPGAMGDFYTLKIQEADVRKMEDAGDKRGAYDKLTALLNAYDPSGQEQHAPSGGMLSDLISQRDRLARDLGISPGSQNPNAKTEQKEGH